MELKKIKSVTYSERVQQSPEYLALAQQGTASLDELLQDTAPRISGPYSLPRVRAEWDRETDDKGRGILTLHIWDEMGEGRSQFTAEEMKTPFIREHYLSRAWDALLRENIEKRLQRLMEDGDDAVA